MQYRKFGRLDWQVSVLGFGVMRLPLTDRDPAHVDEPEAIRMIRYAFDHGVNYVDTAYPYHGGRSEGILGNALKDGYREKVKVATKLLVRLVEEYKDFDRYLNEQLERLQIKQIDFYLLHGLNGRSWPKVRDVGVLKWAEGAMADGRIGYLGFSFHDNFDVFKSIIDDYDNWILSQIQYNYMDVELQAGRRGLEYAAGKGLAAVIMEPLRGGRLGKVPPEAIVKLWESAPKKRTPADWALQWVWNQPEVAVALSGMSTMEQVVENIDSAESSGPNTLTADEAALVDRVREAFHAQKPVDCTNCGYCMPCPNGVEIPTIFTMYNGAIMYNDPGPARWAYRGPEGLKEEQRADQCTECNECLEKCPQEIDIPDWLKKVHEFLGPRKESTS